MYNYGQQFLVIRRRCEDVYVNLVSEDTFGSAIAPKPGGYTGLLLEKYWDGLAGDYDGLYRSAWAELENEYVLESLGWLEGLRKPKVLDLGCGTGLGYELCRQVNPGVEYTGIDISAAMLAEFSAKHPEARVLKADFDTFSLTDLGRFDAIVSFFVSPSYTSSLPRLLRNLGQITGEGAYLRLSLLNKYSIRRLVRLRLGDTEAYGTRGGNPQTRFTDVSVFTRRQVRQIASTTGWELCEQRQFSAFAGTAEFSWLWTLDKSICSTSPGLAHTTDYLLRRVD